MKKRINEKFLRSYLVLDRELCALLFIRAGGISEYISILAAEPLPKGRGEVLSRLIKYRVLRNKLAHEPAALKSLGGISRDDIRWLKKFTASVLRKKDPLSLWRSNMRNRAARKKMYAFLAPAALIMLFTVVMIIFAMRK